MLHHWASEILHTWFVLHNSIEQLYIITLVLWLNEVVQFKTVCVGLCSSNDVAFSSFINFYNLALIRAYMMTFPLTFLNLALIKLYMVTFLF